MTREQWQLLVEFADVISWPIAAIVIVVVLRPFLKGFLSESKVKVSIFGVSIETILPELQYAMTESIGGTLQPEQHQYLEELFNKDEILYPNGVHSPESHIVRPLRNTGLVRTIPTDKSLGSAKAIRLTALGSFLLKHKSKG